MKGKPPPRDGCDDACLWGKEVEDVRRLGTDKIPIKAPPLPPCRQACEAPPLLPAASHQPRGAGMDSRTREKFHQGRMRIEARLDLHGKTLAEAHQDVTAFIGRMVSERRRCLLLITGKGDRLRQALPDWLESGPLAPHILATAEARPEHGGAGARYVLLRRVRD